MDLHMGTTHETNGDLCAVFIEHRSQLERAALRIVNSPAQAQDVVQDAFFKVIEAASAFEVKEPLAYLFQIVRNLAIDAHRRAALEARFFVDAEEGVDVPERAGTPEMVAVYRQDLRIVADALAELPERSRRAFELYRLDGLRQREIAEKLGVSATLVNFMIRDVMEHCAAALRKA